MYFKVKKGTESFNRLSEVWDKVIECNNAARKLVEDMGFKSYARSNWHVGGGISCIQSDYKPEGFKYARSGEKNLFYPNSKNKEVLIKFNTLPVVEFKEYNDSIGYKEQYYPCERGMVHSRMFGSKKVGDVFLIEIADEAKYEPKADMIEILASEYKKLIEK